jgi:hypothetical protein
MDPVWKLSLAVDIGQRTLAMAQRLVHQVTHVLAPHGAPLLLTDGFREYLTALVTHYGQYRRRRIVRVQHRVVFGVREAIESILAKRGWKMNTSCIERLNLALRQHVAAIGRRANTLCTHEAGLRQQLALFQVYHNFVLPHASWRVPLPEVVQGTKSVQRWQQRTPAMAAGLTDRVWSRREVLRYRVPPWPQSQAGKDVARSIMVSLRWAIVSPNRHAELREAMTLQFEAC